jgi:hypothetical protein
MSNNPTTIPEVNSFDNRLFPFERWSSQADRLCLSYQQAQPYPHIVLEDFFSDNVIRRVVSEFPNPDDTEWIQYKHYNENKLGKSKREEFPPYIGSVIDELNSSEFVAFLSKLTGIDGLIPDPMLEGGGMHQTQSGGFLNMHADFTMHHYHKRWRRRCNLIVYLNERWEPEWKGDLELWSRDMKRCVTKVAPTFNRAVIFNTDDTSFHGYPDPIQCPEDVTRKSLALYYFTEESDPGYVAKSTNYQARPTDGFRRVLIWADKQALAVYSKLKARFGFSDDFVSRLLGRRKKK